jgi:hypothetical protein
MNWKAVYDLYPNVVSTDGDNAYDADGSEVEIDMDAINAWQDPIQYQYDRAFEYKSTRQQLDDLWHDIDSGLFGEDAKTGEFYTSIKAVKDAHPKGDE